MRRVPDVRSFARQRAALLRTRAQRQSIADAFRGRHVVEIGGPSDLFRSDDILPVYPAVGAYDAVNYAETTLWDDANRVPDALAVQRTFVGEATRLGVDDGTYGGLLASHVLEHVANPLSALAEWERVVQDGSPVLIVLPHKDVTFDHRRPVTSVDHMVADHEGDVGEDDLTHLDEILALHDLERDPGAGTREAFERRSRANAEHRGLHHHVFDTASAAGLVRRSGFALEDVAAVPALNIVLLARKGGDDRADVAAARARSPFRSDRAA